MTNEVVYYTQNTWNLARGIAADAVDITEEPLSIVDHQATIGELYEAIVESESRLEVFYQVTQLLTATDVREYYSPSNEIWEFEHFGDIIALVDSLDVALSDSDIDTSTIGYLARTIAESDDDSKLFEELMNELDIDGVYGEYATERDVWPFEDRVDLFDLVGEYLGYNQQSRQLNDLAKQISTRVQEDSQYEYDSNTEQDQDDSDSEKKVNQEADSEDTEETAEDDEVEEDTASEASEETDADRESRKSNQKRNSGEETNVENGDKTETSQDTDVETVSVEEINDTTEIESDAHGESEPDGENISDGDEGENVDETNQLETEDGEEYYSGKHARSDETAELARKMYTCFKSSQDVTYGDIISEYDSPIPRRSVSLQLVMNARGSSKKDKIADIEKWVRNWYGDKQAVEEENGFARKPMGASSAQN